MSIQPFSKKILTLSLGLALSISLSACQHNRPQADHDYTAATLASAKSHYKNHRYNLAFNQLQLLAKQGDPDAQYSLGFMHFNGLGTLQNQQTGMYWIRQSASQGYNKALEALGMLQATQPAVAASGHIEPQAHLAGKRIAESTKDKAVALG